METRSLPHTTWNCWVDKRLSWKTLGVAGLPKSLETLIEGSAVSFKLSVLYDLYETATARARVHLTTVCRRSHLSIITHYSV